MEENGICNAAFCESAALRESFCLTQEACALSVISLRSMPDSPKGELTPSVIAYGDATFPKGTAFSGSDKVSGSTQRLPLGGAGALAPEGVTPPVKMG